MGNRCCGSFFGRVKTAKELRLTWPDEETSQTAAGPKSGLEMRQAYSVRAVTDKLTALSVVIMLYFVLGPLVAGLGFSLVPGYPNVTDTVGTGTRVPHSIWFISSAILVFLWGMSFSFDPYYQVSRIIFRSRVFNGFLLIDLLQNIAHLVLTIIEVVQGTSGLASNTTTPSGTFFLITLIVFLVIFLIFDIFIYSISGNYATLLNESMLAGWQPGVIGSRGRANNTLVSPSGDNLAYNSFVSTGAPMAQSGDVRVSFKPSSSGMSMVDNLINRKRNKKK